MIFGPRFHKAQRAEGLEYARQWRESMRPHFDAIYGPERVLGTCAACGQTALVDKHG